jgi:hypothetical protein
VTRPSTTAPAVAPAGSVALSYVILGERPAALQLLGVALVLTGVLVAVSGRGRLPAAQDQDHPPRLGRVEGHVVVEVPVTSHQVEPAGQPDRGD